MWPDRGRPGCVSSHFSFRRRPVVLILLVALAFAISACSAAVPDEEAIDLDTVGESSPATDAMRAAGASTMADVIDALGVDLIGTGSATFFVPSDRAFLALDADVLASISLKTTSWSASLRITRSTVP